jgi:hypothetical protein
MRHRGGDAWGRMRHRPSRCGSCLRTAGCVQRSGAGRQKFRQQRLLHAVVTPSCAARFLHLRGDAQQCRRAGPGGGTSIGILTTNMPPVLSRKACCPSPNRAAIRCGRARRTSGSWRRTRCRPRRCLPSRREQAIQKQEHCSLSFAVEASRARRVWPRFTVPVNGFLQWAMELAVEKRT